MKTMAYGPITSWQIDGETVETVTDFIFVAPTSQFKSINSSVLSFLYSPTLTSIHDYWKNHSFDQMDLWWKGMSLLLHMLSRLVITFLPRRKCLLIS